TVERFVYGFRAVRAMATNTFRASVRSRVFIALLIFCAGIMLSSLLLGALSLHNELRVTTDVTLFASTIFSAAITIYVTIDLLHTEIDRHTIHTILSKPVRRWQFVLGKFLGILALMAAIVALLFGFAATLVALQGGTITLELGYAFALIYLQIVILTAAAMLFASYSSPLLSGLFAAAVFVLGHLHEQLETLASTFEGAWLRRLADVLEHVVPDLASLNLTVELVRDIPVPSDYLLTAVWYASSYAAIALFGAMIVFSNRDIE
ncbi:MAG: ABC transporter permease, partial [Bradymonadaceae bacterium]